MGRRGVREQVAGRPSMTYRLSGALWLKRLMALDQRDRRRSFVGLLRKIDTMTSREDTGIRHLWIARLLDCIQRFP